jgi:hypothetical protein
MISKVYFLLTIFVLIGLLLLLFTLPGYPGYKSDPHIIRIGVKNILFNNPYRKDILRNAFEEQLDIVLFIEYNGKNINLSEIRQKGYKAVVVHPRPFTHGLLLLAKKSIRIKGVVKSPPVKGLCRLPYVVARIQIKRYNIAFFGIHIPPPTKRCIENRRPTLNYFTSLVENGHLRQDIGPAKVDDEVIILGDFNFISFEPALDALNRAGLEDAYNRHHWRPGPTWSQPTWFPAVFRIDFIFISRQIETTGTWATHIKGSDHRGVVTDVLID